MFSWVWVLFEMKCFSYHFVFAFQLTHGLFIVVILAHHNNPQSGGGEGLDFFFICYQKLFYSFVLVTSDDFIDAEWMDEWIIGLMHSYFTWVLFLQDNCKCIYFNYTGTLNMSVSVPLDQQHFLAIGCLIIMSWFSFGTQLHRRLPPTSPPGVGGVQVIDHWCHCNCYFLK